MMYYKIEVNHNSNENKILKLVDKESLYKINKKAAEKVMSFNGFKRNLTKLCEK